MNVPLTKMVDELGVDKDASAAEVRARLMRRLPEDDFVPPEPWLRPLQLLRRPNLQEVLSVEVESGLHEEVEAFAAGFFDLPLEERRRRWIDLQNRCASCLPLTMRLAHLEEGLEVAPVQFDDYGLQLLWEKVQELFVLRRTEQAERRREFLQCSPEQTLTLKRLSRRFQKGYSRLACLEPALWEAITRQPLFRGRVYRHVRFLAMVGRRVLILIGIAMSAFLLIMCIALLSFSLATQAPSRDSAPNTNTAIQEFNRLKLSYDKIYDPVTKRTVYRHRKSGKAYPNLEALLAVEMGSKHELGAEDIEVLPFPSEDTP